MRNRRRARFLRRLVLGFAVALVAVPAAQAYPDEGGAQPQAYEGATPPRGFLQDTIGGSAIQTVVRGDYKDLVGTSPATLVIAGDDKRGIGSGPIKVVIAADDKQNVPVGVNYEPATHNQFAYRRALPQDLGPQAAVLAGLAAETRETVASARPVVSGSAQVVSSSDGFDWGDAGMGAGLVFAIMLLGGLAVLATRHVSRPASV